MGLPSPSGLRTQRQPPARPTAQLRGGSWAGVPVCQVSPEPELRLVPSTPPREQGCSEVNLLREGVLRGVGRLWA